MPIFRSRSAIAGGIAAACMAAAGVSTADAMTVGVQDQGADPAALQAVYAGLGASSVRVVVRAGEPQVALIRDYRARGMTVQAAVLVKRSTTPQDIARTVAAWDGTVRTVSIGNEPELNGLPACTYVRLYRRTYRLLKRMGVRVGFGEFSPVRREYIEQALTRCGRVPMDYLAGHWYQFRSDPLQPATERSGVGTWTGIGDLTRIRALMRRAGHKHTPIACTEFTYLTSGRYRVTPDKTAWLIPRAVKQARKWCSQLIWYGIGAVHDGPDQSWGSGSLLDLFGRRLPGYLALARALGRTLPPELEAPLVDATSHARPNGIGDLVPLLPAAYTSGHGEGDADQVETPVVVPAEPQHPPVEPEEQPPPVDIPPSETPVEDPTTESGTWPDE